MSPYVCITFFPVGNPVTLTPLIANDVKGIIIGVINVLQVTYKGIQMVKSKEDASAIMTLTLLHHENVNQCINTTGYWIRFHRCLVICLQGTNASVSGTVACMYVSLDGFRLNPDMWSYPEMPST